MESMGDDRRRDGTGMGNAKGPVVPEAPDVVRRGAKIGAKAIAAAQVLVCSMDRLGPGVQLGDATLGPDIARSAELPDGAAWRYRSLPPISSCRAIAASVRPRCAGERGHTSPPEASESSIVTPIVGIPTIGTVR